MAELERKVEVRIADWLRRDGWYVVKVELQAGRGWPDLTCYKDGKVLHLEVKRPGGLGVVSKQQRKIHADLLKAGHQVHIVTSLEEVQNLVPTT